MEIPKTYRTAHLAKFEWPEEYVIPIVEWYKSKENILFCTSDVGVGKTYLCHAIYQDVLDQKMPVRFFPERKFLNTLRETIQKGWDYEYEIERLCDVQWLILDDLGFVKPNDWHKEVLFSMLDNRYSSQKPTLITSNLGHKEILDTYGKRFASRLYSNRNKILEPKDLPNRRETEV